ncbi:class I SAM-dependent methyltransferase [Fischerella sp. PCC 9605]|uniref:class I SAM-dependent methyltransferase n=1 Tax=Fischerella sp. PCC 9605 TaxID=1173024 RepID=UPI0004AF6B23|nr:class I SAM-dependent methyltransferase [Fischerella sp. PCC 9605]
MEPTKLFYERETDYVKYRPSYPADAINAILEGLGERSQLVAADIGAGTGIASRLLAERGVRVIAIEPNTSMRQAADTHPLIEFSDATAEATKLPNASVDLLTCFQAFHWFDPAPTLSEFRRILKPSGRLALVWNHWAADNKFLEEFGCVLRKAASKDSPKKKVGSGFKPLLSSPHFTNIRRCTFTHSHELDLPGIIGYAQSKYFVPRSGSSYEQLILDLQELHTRWADDRGLVRLDFCTTVYLAKPQLYDFPKFMTRWRSWFLTKWWKLNKATT